MVIQPCFYSLRKRRRREKGEDRGENKGREEGESVQT